MVDQQVARPRCVSSDPKVTHCKAKVGDSQNGGNHTPRDTRGLFDCSGPDGRHHKKWRIGTSKSKAGSQNEGILCHVNPHAPLGRQCACRACFRLPAPRHKNDHHNENHQGQQRHTPMKPMSEGPSQRLSDHWCNSKDIGQGSHVALKNCPLMQVAQAHTRDHHASRKTKTRYEPSPKQLGIAVGKCRDNGPQQSQEQSGHHGWAASPMVCSTSHQRLSQTQTQNKQSHRGRSGVGVHEHVAWKNR